MILEDMEQENPRSALVWLTRLFSSKCTLNKVNKGPELKFCKAVFQWLLPLIKFGKGWLHIFIH
jgi:hypothetical protein